MEKHHRKVKKRWRAAALGRSIPSYGTQPAGMMHMFSRSDRLMALFNADGGSRVGDGAGRGRGKLRMCILRPTTLRVHRFRQRRAWESSSAERAAPMCRRSTTGGEMPDRGARHDGSAEVSPAAAWRAVSKQGACSGGGTNGLRLDMPGYIQQMAEWMDESEWSDPCNFEAPIEVSQIMMAFAVRPLQAVRLLCRGVRVPMRSSF